MKKVINVKMLSVFLENPDCGIPKWALALGVGELVLKLRRKIEIIHEYVLYRSWFVVFERN